MSGNINTCWEETHSRVASFTCFSCVGRLVEKDAVSYVQLSTNGYAAIVITDNLP